MSCDFAYEPRDIFQGLDFSNFIEHLAANNPYLDPNSEEYLAINPIQDSKPDQPIDEYTGILETPEMLSGLSGTDGISGGYGIDNKPPIDERPNAPIGIPIEHLIAGITGKPVLGPDGNIIEPTPGDANLGFGSVQNPGTAPGIAEGIAGMIPADPSYVDPMPTPDYIESGPALLPSEQPETGIASLNNSKVFERMRALARQPRNYKSYIG